MAGVALTGACLAAAYGAIHDQITFVISPEYFTRMKFRQFAWANVGLPPRAFASVVGVLATWWVGLFAGWFLARLGLDRLRGLRRAVVMRRAFTILLITAACAGVAGGLFGLAASRADLSGWQPYRDAYALTDLPSFVIIAWVHAAGYAGALAGLVLAAVSVRRSLRA